MKTLIAAAGIAALMLSGALVSTVDARGANWTVESSTSNTNPSGKNQPPGHQNDQEKDSPGWTSETTRTVTNPGGNQPPGQQDK